jgi:leader peptidase (prepilin peptidase) / N-methyltransferase
MTLLIHDFYHLFYSPQLTLPLSIIWLIWGFIAGSFLNVVISRLPQMLERNEYRYLAQLQHQDDPYPDTFNLAWPPSHCPHCKNRIKPFNNLPLIGFLYLKGRCSYCKSSISWRYPIIECCGGLLSLLFAWRYGSTMTGLFSSIMAFMLLALAVIDTETQLLPDDLTLPLLWMGLLINTFGIFTNLYDAVYGAAMGYLSLWSIFWLFKLLRGKDGMGYGDFKLMAALGAWWGWTALPHLILIAALTGLCAGLYLRFFGKLGQDVPFAFGPALAFSGFIQLMAGPGPWFYHFLSEIGF